MGSWKNEDYEDNHKEPVSFNASPIYSCSECASYVFLIVSWKNTNDTMFIGNQIQKSVCTFIITNNYGFTWIKTKSIIMF